MSGKTRKGAAVNGGAARNVTSRDVAEVLNISQSTVSRAFTPGASISPSLKERIYAAAEKIGYRPNLLARGLIAGKSKLVGVVLARQTNLLYPELLYELSGRLAQEGYQVLLFPIGDGVPLAEAIDRIWSYRVDAVLATGLLDEEDIAAFEAHDLPLVTFNRVYDMPVPSVSCDFAAGARELAKRLIRAGFDDVGLIAGPETSYVSNEVERGARTVLDASGARLAITRHDYEYESGAAALSALQKGAGGLPRALICVNDTVAAGCLDHLRGPMGLKVPEDIALTAFGGFGPSHWQGYRITGMRQPMEDMMAAAVSLLLERIADSTKSAERRSFLPIFVDGATAAL